MEKESKKMIKYTEIAKKHLVKNEDISYKMLGRYHGEVSDTYSKGEGIMVATNKRLFFGNKRNIASFNYEKILNIDIFKKTLDRLTLSIQYIRINIQITNNHTDEKNINELLSFLSNPEYDKKINFSEVFKTTEITIYNNKKKAQQTKPLIEEKPKQIKETKCTCQACGKVWFYGKEE